MKYIILTLSITLFAFVPAMGKTFTEGVLDHEQFLRETNDLYKKYCIENNQLSHGIIAVQKNISRLKQQFKQKNTYEEKALLQSIILEKNSELIHLCNKRYQLVFDKLIPVKTNLKKLKEMSEKGLINTHALKRIKNTNKKNMYEIYQKLSALAQNSKDPGFKKSIASLLSENEKIYRQNIQGIKFFRRFKNRVESFDAHVSSILGQTRLNVELLNQKKNQLLLSINLMKNNIALYPIENMIKNIKNNDQLNNITQEIILDPLIDINSQVSEDSLLQKKEHIDPIDKQLEEYSNGPDFLMD